VRAQQFVGALAAQDKALGAGARDQGRAMVERRRNRRHQHRLLGIRRAAHAAIAQVPAAVDVAADEAGLDAEFIRTAS
jgi:hypothetical protein